MAIRTYKDIIAAKDSVATSENTLTVADLLPGYLVGGSLEFIDEVAYIAPVAAAVQGKRIEISEKIRLEDCYWEVKKLNNYRYYVYLDTLAVLHVDVRAPMIINKMMGLYHPSTGWRYINTFYSNNVGRITETTVSTLNIIGYSGDGTPYAPQEGDRRVYIDEDEIRFEEYTGGAWTSVNSIVIGGADSYGNFLPFLGCRGIYNTLTDPPASNPIPDPLTLIFSFETDYNPDYDPTDYMLPYAAAQRIQRSSGWSKFGTYSLYGSSSLNDNGSYVAYYRAPDQVWVTGNPITMGGFVNRVGTSWADKKVLEIENGNDVSYTVRIGVQTGLTGAFAYLIETNPSGAGAIQTVYVQENTGVVTSNSVGEHYLGVSYDPVDNTLTLIVDDQKFVGDVDALSLETESGDSIFYIRASDYSGQEFYVDYVTLSPDGAIDGDALIQHWQSDLPWDTSYSAKDIVLKPATGGVVRVLGEVQKTIYRGDVSITTSSDEVITLPNASTTQQERGYWWNCTSTGKLRFYDAGTAAYLDYEGEGEGNIVLAPVGGVWKVKTYDDAGSNANGKWRKFKDGWADIWGSMTVTTSTSVGNAFGTSAGTVYYTHWVWTFPLTASEAPERSDIMLSAVGGGNPRLAMMSSNDSDPTTTQIEATVVSSTNGASVEVAVRAKIRWKA